MVEQTVVGAMKIYHSRDQRPESGKMTFGKIYLILCSKLWKIQSNDIDDKNQTYLYIVTQK